ncbi:MAG: radical SAM protein [Clostridia bacterium]|nr:radical SAM protein [Clostridia bacterium]
MRNDPVQAQIARQLSAEPKLVTYLFTKAGVRKVPLSGTFELTPRCNFNCKMCYVHLSKEEQEARGRELTAAEWIALGEECSKQGMLFLLLTGGEPLIRPDFREIYLGLKKLGLILSINTNGSLIDDEMIEFLKANPPYKLNITLYGSSPEVYNEVNGNPAAFEKTYRAIKALKEAGLAVKLNCSTTQYNRDDVGNIYNLAADLNIHTQIAEYMFPPMRISAESAGKAVRLSAKEAGREMFLNIKRRSYDEKLYLMRLRKVASGIKVIDEDAECLDVPTAETLTATEHIRCRAGSCAFWVSWDGKLSPCGMMVEPSCSITELGFAEAWERVCEATRAIMMPPKCTNCDKRFACVVCAASTYCETGCFGKDEPTYICEMIEEYLRIVHEEYERLLKEGAYEDILKEEAEAREKALAAAEAQAKPEAEGKKE